MSSFIGDLKNQATISASIRPVSVTTGTTNGVGVDCLTYEGTMSVVCSVGVITGTYSTLQFSVTESDDNSSFTAMTEAPATIAAMAQNTDATLTFWKRAKRYVRVNLVATGGSTAVVSAIVIGRKKITGSGSGSQL